MKKHSILFSNLLIVLFLLLHSTFAQEVDDETEFDYMRGSERGPERWGHIKEEWAECKTGRMQSPIDLLHPKVVQVFPKTQEIIKLYNFGNATVKNRGHDIMIEWENEDSKIQINGTTYILRQCHWHSPSEHTINGVRFAAELHLVHQSKCNKIAVIGLLYKLGKPDGFLTKLMEKLELVPHALDKTNAGEINPGEIKLRGRMYYRYIGSLTTPPCTQGVLWTLDKQIATISETQVAKMREVVHDDAEKNARPVQARNGRKIRLYTTIKQHSPHNHY